MEPKQEEIGHRLGAALQERVAAYADREGQTLGESISALLYLGLEFEERQRTGSIGVDDGTRPCDLTATSRFTRLAGC